MAPEWDEEKRQWNLSNRGFDFADADHLDLRTRNHAPSSRRSDYGEARYLSTGYLHGRLVRPRAGPSETAAFAQSL